MNEVRCLSCARLERNDRFYSCPQNRKFNPYRQHSHFAEKCPLYVPGEPRGSKYFDVEIGGNGRIVHVTAKEGWELKILPESTPQKIIITAWSK